MLPRHMFGICAVASVLTGFGSAFGQDAPPRVPDELTALAKVPTVEITITDEGGGLVPGVNVNYRSLTDGLSGGGVVPPDGIWTRRPTIAWSQSGGFRFSSVGPHRIEIVAPGFRTIVFDSVDLDPGHTQRLRAVLRRRVSIDVLGPDEYRRRAAEVVLQSARGPKGSEGQVLVVGAPVLLPPHVRERQARLPRPLPEAFVQTTLFVNARFREPVSVMFTDGNGEARFSYPPRSAGFLPLEEGDWKEIAPKLAAFYAVAADVAGGPERFDSYLPADLRGVFDLAAEKNRLFLTIDAARTLSNEQLRRFLVLTMDAVVVRTWQSLAGLQPIPMWSPNQVRQSPAQVIADLERATAAGRRSLEAEEFLASERVRAAIPYVGRLLGEGTVVREDPGRDGVRTPRGSRMFTVGMGGLYPHFIIRDGTLTLVAVDLP